MEIVQTERAGAATIMLSRIWCGAAVSGYFIGKEFEQERTVKFYSPEYEKEEKA